LTVGQGGTILLEGGDDGGGGNKRERERKVKEEARRKPETGSTEGRKLPRPPPRGNRSRGGRTVRNRIAKDGILLNLREGASGGDRERKRIENSNTMRRHGTQRLLLDSV